MLKKVFILFSFFYFSSNAQNTFYNHFGTSECLNEVWDGLELDNGNVIIGLSKINCLNQNPDNSCELLSIDNLGKKTLIRKWKYDPDEQETIGGIHKLNNNSFAVVTSIKNTNSLECHLGFYHFNDKFDLLNKKRILLDSIESTIVFKSYYDTNSDKLYFSFNNQDWTPYIGSVQATFNNFKLKNLGLKNLIFETSMAIEGDKYLLSVGGVNYSIDTALLSLNKFTFNPNDYDNSAIKKYGKNSYLTLAKEISNYPPKWGDLESDNISCKMVDKQMNVLKYASLGKPRGVEDTMESISYRGLSWRNPNKIYVTWTSVSHYELGDVVENVDTWVALAQLDSNLNVKWTRYYFGKKLNAAFGLIPTNDNGVFIYGRQSFDGEYSDGFVMKVKENGALTSSNEVENSFQITIGPNPCTTHFDIAIGVNENDNQDFNLDIYDILGHSVKNQTINAGINTIDVSNLQSATYFYTVKEKNKIVKQGKIVK